MRRILILCMILLAGPMARAGVVTPEQARSRAAAFFATSEPRTRAAAARPEDFRLVRSFPEDAARSAAEAPALYVFERTGGGFAVMSGDDAARSVLGFSFDGRFPTAAEMPENMADMFDWYASVINYARRQGWSAAAAKAPDLDPANSKVLETAHWAQREPFNNLAPLIDGQKPPIGCVATATAIVMQYHKWPKQGTGTLPDYEYYTNFLKDGADVHIDGLQLGHTYNWDLMPGKASGFTADEAAQIARLCYDVAVMLQMCFGPDGSGADTRDVCWLIKYFGYDKQMFQYKRADFASNTQWEQIVKDEINAGRPVIYDGFNKAKNGHAFVIDGYNDRYFSINYGWGEGSDFYTLTPIEGHEKDLTEYAQEQRVVCRIMPDQGGAPEITLQGTSDHLIDYDFDPKNFLLRSSFIIARSFAPVSYEYSCTAAFGLYDSKGNLKEIISEETPLTIPVGSWDMMPSVICKITKTLADGDRIAVSIKDPQKGTWEAIPQIRQGEIVFTKQPLSELVRIGYDDNPPESFLSAQSGRTLNINIQAYKDLCWYVSSEANPADPVLWSGGGGFMDSDAVGTTGDFSDDETVSAWIWLPEGNHLAVFRNPLTGETMTVRLEL